MFIIIMCIKELFIRLIETIYLKMKIDNTINISDIYKELKSISGSNIICSKWTNEPLLSPYMEKMIISVNSYNIDNRAGIYDIDGMLKGNNLYNMIMIPYLYKPVVYNILYVAMYIGMYKYYNSGKIEDWMVIENWVDSYNIDIITNMLLVHNDYIKDVMLIINRI